MHVRCTRSKPFWATLHVLSARDGGALGAWRQHPSSNASLVCLSANMIVLLLFGHAISLVYAEQMSCACPQSRKVFIEGH